MRATFRPLSLSVLFFIARYVLACSQIFTTAS
jgi:hypothetical protein